MLGSRINFQLESLRLWWLACLVAGVCLLVFPLKEYLVKIVEQANQGGCCILVVRGFEEQVRQIPLMA